MSGEMGSTDLTCTHPSPTHPQGLSPSGNSWLKGFFFSKESICKASVSRCFHLFLCGYNFLEFLKSWEFLRFSFLFCMALPGVQNPSHKTSDKPNGSQRQSSQKAQRAANNPAQPSAFANRKPRRSEGHHGSQ